MFEKVGGFGILGTYLTVYRYFEKKDRRFKRTSRRKRSTDDDDDDDDDARLSKCNCIPPSSSLGTK